MFQRIGGAGAECGRQKRFVIIVGIINGTLIGVPSGNVIWMRAAYVNFGLTNNRLCLFIVFF